MKNTGMVGGPSTSGYRLVERSKSPVKIAIIGGGPAGSFCAIHLLREARELQKPIEVVIFDHKVFGRTGPGGCNLCAGVIARSMIDNLREIDVPIPAEVVQRRIDGFVLFYEGGKLEIDGRPEDEFYSVFRGGGPRGKDNPLGESFDDALLKHARSLGATHIQRLVHHITLPGGLVVPVLIHDSEGESYAADVVIGAFGVNSTLVRQVEEMGFGYRGPRSLRVGGAEFPLPEAFIDETFRGRIKVFCLRFPAARRVQFVALTPKRGYVTASIIGRDVGQEEIERVFQDPRILAHFPPGWEVPADCCKCYPSLPLLHARKPYTDRLVMIGDAHVSRYYKNGIGSAFNTARWAAETILHHGITESDFRRHYYGKCKSFYYADNLLGRSLFRINEVVSKRGYVANGGLWLSRLMKRGGSQGLGTLEQMLWSLFTGDRQYRDIVWRALSFWR